MKNILSLLPISAALVSPVLASAASVQQPSQTKDSKKNVIFVIVDDMRLDMLAYAGGKALTPNLDALRNVSVDFENACTTTGLSSPSRAALFTGRLGHRTGLEDNLHLWHCRDITLPKEQTTIYEWAHTKDYNIGYFGKWHVGHISPKDRGADEYVGSPGETTIYKPERPSFAAVKDYYNKKKYKGKDKPHYYSTLNVSYEKSEPKKQVDLAVDFLSRVKDDDRPFFLSVGFHSPHPSYKVPAPWDKMYSYKDVVLPESMHSNKKGLEFQHDVLWPWMDLGHMSDDDWRKTISYSMGMVTMLDKALGELFDKIKAEGMWDNTLIIFTSDQGSMLAEHGLYDKGPYAYEGLMRIPMLVKAPGVEHNTIKHQVSLIDLNQTMVEYMGLQPSQANMDSRSLLPLVYDGEEAWANVPDESYYTYEIYNGRWFGVRAIRTPQYKYSFNPHGSDELYDIENDPHEMNNLVDSKEYADVLKDMRVRLLTRLKNIEDTHAYNLMSDFTGIYL